MQRAFPGAACLERRGAAILCFPQDRGSTGNTRRRPGLAGAPLCVVGAYERAAFVAALRSYARTSDPPVVVQFQRHKIRGLSKRPAISSSDQT